MTYPLKAGLIGAGVFGRWHAEKYAAHPDVTFVGAFDTNTQRSDTLSHTYGGKAYSSLSGLLADCDLVSIATPASGHAESALLALDMGVATLIEKPMAANTADAARLLAHASQTGIRLALGHQEWLVLHALGVLAFGERPLGIHAVRHTRRSKRGQDVPVSIDLMVHDANLVLALMGGERPNLISANSTDPDEQVVADLKFPAGPRVRLDASRTAETPKRDLWIEYPSGSVYVDFARRMARTSSGLKLTPSADAERILADPVGENIHRFIAAVRSGEPAEQVDAQSGYEALWLAETVHAVAQSGTNWSRSPIGNTERLLQTL